MRLQMRGVDHDPLRLAAFGRQCGEYLVEHTQPAPTDEAVIDRLMRTVFLRRVAPAHSVLDYKHDGADDAPVIHPSDPMRERKYGEIRRICASDSKNRSDMAKLLAPPLES